MEPEGSSPYIQEPATCPCPEPDQFILRPPTQPLAGPFQYYPPIYAWVFQVVSFPQVSPLKPCMHLSSPPYVPHVLPISVFLTSSPEWYLVRSTEHKAPRYAVFSTRLLRHLSWAQISSSIQT
jgi:hypothetical protein